MLSPHAGWMFIRIWSRQKHFCCHIPRKFTSIPPNSSVKKGISLEIPPLHPKNQGKLRENTDPHRSNQRSSWSLAVIALRAWHIETMWDTKTSFRGTSIYWFFWNPHDLFVLKILTQLSIYRSCTLNLTLPRLCSNLGLRLLWSCLALLWPWPDIHPSTLSGQPHKNILETYVPCNFKASTQLGLYFIKGFGEILTLKGKWKLAQS